MKPLIILLVGGLSLAATLTVTHWLSAHESDGAAVLAAPAAVQQVQAEETTPASTNRSSYRRHGWKRSKGDHRNVARSESESQ
jgi:hypothetical protein